MSSTAELTGYCKLSYSSQMLCLNGSPIPHWLPIPVRYCERRWETLFHCVLLLSYCPESWKKQTQKYLLCRSVCANNDVEDCICMYLLNDGDILKSPRGAWFCRTVMKVCSECPNRAPPVGLDRVTMNVSFTSGSASRTAQISNV